MSEIMTYTKKMFDPLHPNAELIDTEDIAHALSMLCRANGHFKSFYSVAQHSINCMKEAKARGYSERIQLACLLHDASEAYLSDVTRPVKAELPRYKEIEARSQTQTSLLDFGSLSFGKVPKRLKGARVAESPSVCQSAKRAKRETRDLTITKISLPP